MKKGNEVFELVTSGNLNFVYVEGYKEALREVVQDALEEVNFFFFEDDITKEGKEQQDSDSFGVTIASESKSKGSGSTIHKIK
jgi:hypothetical protein